MAISIEEEALKWAGKIATFLITFLGGVVTATWTVAIKYKGTDDRILALERARQEEQEKNAQERLELNKKLDRLHERIDQVLMQWIKCKFGESGATEDDIANLARTIRREDERG